MRDIPGYENKYAITSCGRVYSYRAKRFLKPFNRPDGYLSVGLSKNNKETKFLIHRLVAEAYLPNPKNLAFVNHKDEDKTNNALSNLEWISHKDNCNFGTRNERMAKKHCRKVKCLSTGKIYESLSEAAEDVGITYNTIIKHARGRLKRRTTNWQYIGDETI